MSLKIVLLLLSISSLKIAQKCEVQQSLSMQPWVESLHRQHHHELRKKLRRSSPISYYSNTSATHRILLGGDIETNPGPTSTTNSALTPTNNKQNSKKAATKRKAPICSICEKTVRINSKRMICTYCKLLTHLHYKTQKHKQFQTPKMQKIGFVSLVLQLNCHFTMKWCKLHKWAPGKTWWTKETHKYFSPKYPINILNFNSW